MQTPRFQRVKQQGRGELRLLTLQAVPCVASFADTLVKKLFSNKYRIQPVENGVAFLLASDIT
jgi:hypothetical protein